MSNYTSTFLPKVSLELAQRVYNEVVSKDLIEFEKAMRGENPNLYQKLVNSSQKQEVNNTTFKMYGILRKSALRVSSAKGFDGFTHSGLPIVLGSTISKNSQDENIIDENYLENILSENPVAFCMLMGNSVPIEFGVFDNKFILPTKGIFYGGAICYILLHEQGKLIAESYGIDTENPQKRVLN